MVSRPLSPGQNQRPQDLQVPVPTFPLSSPISEEIESPSCSSAESRDLERTRPFDFLVKATRQKVESRKARDARSSGLFHRDRQDEAASRLSGIRGISKKKKSAAKPVGLNLVTDFTLAAPPKKHKHSDVAAPFVDLNDLKQLSKARGKERTAQMNLDSSESRNPFVKDVPRAQPQQQQQLSDTNGDSPQINANPFLDPNLQNPFSDRADHGLSPSDRNVMIGLKVPYADPSHRNKEVDGSGDQYTPLTPSIIVTPAREDAPWLTPSPEETQRPRAASSVYSRPTSTSRGWDTGTDSIPPVPAIPEAHKKALGSEFLSAHFNAMTRKRRSNSADTIFEDADPTSPDQSRRYSHASIDDNDQVPLASRLSVNTQASRPESQGWWTVLLSPLLGKKSPISPSFTRTALASSSPPSSKGTKEWWDEKETSHFSPDTPATAVINWDEGNKNLEQSRSIEKDEASTIISKRQTVLSTMFPNGCIAGEAAEYYQACAHELFSKTPLFECVNHICSVTPESFIKAMEEECPGETRDRALIFAEAHGTGTGGDNEKTIAPSEGGTNGLLIDVDSPDLKSSEKEIEVSPTKSATSRDSWESPLLDDKEKHVEASPKQPAPAPAPVPVSVPVPAVPEPEPTQDTSRGLGVEPAPVPAPVQEPPPPAPAPAPVPVLPMPMPPPVQEPVPQPPPPAPMPAPVQEPIYQPPPAQEPIYQPPPPQPMPPPVQEPIYQPPAPEPVPQPMQPQEFPQAHPQVIHNYYGAHQDPRSMQQPTHHYGPVFPSQSEAPPPQQFQPEQHQFYQQPQPQASTNPFLNGNGERELGAERSQGNTEDQPAGTNPFLNTNSERDLGTDRSQRNAEDHPPGPNAARETEPISPGFQRAAAGPGAIQMSEVNTRDQPDPNHDHDHGHDINAPAPAYSQYPREEHGEAALPPRYGLHPAPGAAIMDPTAPIGPGEAQRRRLEREDAVGRKVGGFWRGRGPVRNKGFFGRPGREGRLRRRWYLGICTLFLIIIIVAIVLATTLTKRGNETPVQSNWLNLTGYPPMPTGIATIAGTDTRESTSRCIQPSSLWSCALPKDQQSDNEPYGADEPSFRVQILFRNGSYDNSTAEISKSKSKAKFRRGDNIDWTPSPSTPSLAEQAFLGNTTDGNSAPFAGEETPFYFTMLSPVHLSSTDLYKRSNSSSGAGIKASNLTDIFPAPDEDSDGSPAAASLYPLPSSQPIRLYNRNKDNEHYGFYTYFDKSIFLASDTPLTGGTVDKNSKDEDGGSLESDARVRCTWSQTRFLVQIWTRPDQLGRSLLSGGGGSGRISSNSSSSSSSSTKTSSSSTATSTSSTATSSSSATDYDRPGSFPYPVSITVDRHGGDSIKKLVYCYGIEGGSYNITEKMLQVEYRGTGGTLVNPVQGEKDRDRDVDGTDGGSGGCGCEWINWIATE